MLEWMQMSVITGPTTIAVMLLECLCFTNVRMTLFYLCYNICVITDVDECNYGSDNCSSDAVCTDTDGGFTCQCKIGFSGDGYTCTGMYYI